MICLGWVRRLLPSQRDVTLGSACLLLLVLLELAPSPECTFGFQRCIGS